MAQPKHARIDIQTTDVVVRYTNDRVFKYQEVRESVYQWLRGMTGGWMSWGVTDYYEPYNGGRIQRGLIFQFFQANDALLFKLTWGGQ